MLTPDTWQKVTAKAKEQGISRSDLIESTLIKHIWERAELSAFSFSTKFNNSKTPIKNVPLYNYLYAYYFFIAFLSKKNNNFTVHCSTSINLNMITDFSRQTTVMMTDAERRYIQSLSGKGSINFNFHIILDRYKRLIEESTYELADIFTSDEWLYMAATMRNQMPDEMYRYDKGALLSHLMNYRRKGLQKMYAVNMDGLIDKINSLHAANIDALYTRLIEFDRNIDKIDKESWSRF